MKFYSLLQIPSKQLGFVKFQLYIINGWCTIITNVEVTFVALSCSNTLLCSNVRGLAGNLSDLTVASSQYDMLLCSETLVSDMRHVSKVLVRGFCRPVLLCRGKMPRVRGMAAYVRDGYGAFRQPTQI